MKKNLLALAVSLAAGSIALAQQTRSNQGSDAAAYGIFLQGVATQPNDENKDGSLEKYATTSTGVDLYWTAFVPDDGMRHPAVLVLHPGGFKTGRAGPAIVAKNMSKAGFLGLATEYRLAPPHGPMNSPRHVSDTACQARSIGTRARVANVLVNTSPNATLLTSRLR